MTDVYASRDRVLRELRGLELEALPESFRPAVAEWREAEAVRAAKRAKIEAEARARVERRSAPRPEAVYARAYRPSEWVLVIVGIDWPGRYEYGGGCPGVSIASRDPSTGRVERFFVPCRDEASFFARGMNSGLCDFEGKPNRTLRRELARSRRMVQTTEGAA